MFPVEAFHATLERAVRIFRRLGLAPLLAEVLRESDELT